MKVKNIQQINESVFILKHFIDLSAKLLPILYSLDKNGEQTEKDQLDKKKIVDVFSNYQFETETSKVLIESNILELIKNCYHKIIHSASEGIKKESLIEFLKEYNRLKNNWQIVECN